MLFLEEPNFVWDLHFVDTDFFLTKNHFGTKRSQNSDLFYLFFQKNILDQNFVRSKICLSIPDMEKGADRQTLSVEIFENCGNFWNGED